MSKSGLINIEFNQELEIPSIFKSSSDENRRILQNLEEINPTQVFGVKMHLMSEVSPRDLSYSL